VVCRHVPLGSCGVAGKKRLRNTGLGNTRSTAIPYKRKVDNRSYLKRLQHMAYTRNAKSHRQNVMKGSCLLLQIGE
jgi:hypothetical protein